MKQQQPRLMGATGLALLVLSYAMALPWLVRGEAVHLVPFLCALVFGCCLIRPLSVASSARQCLRGRQRCSSWP